MASTNNNVKNNMYVKFGEDSSSPPGYAANDYHTHMKNLVRMTSTIDGPRFPNMFNRRVPEVTVAGDKPPVVSEPPKTVEGPDYHTHIMKLEKATSTINGPRFPSLFRNRKPPTNYVTKGVDAESEAFIKQKHQSIEDPKKGIAMKA